jgi:GntR family transcriptional regulator/MocR family aminotransferase
MALWCRGPAGLDIEAWAARAQALGVSFQTGRHFAFDGRARPFLRLGYARLTEAELREAVRRLAQARVGLR